MDPVARACATAAVWGFGSYFAYRAQASAFDLLASGKIDSVPLNFLPAFTMGVCTYFIWFDNK